MERHDLEIGDVDVIQDVVESLLGVVENKENHTNHFPPSIYMAPSVLRDVSPSSFNPRVVSIGPLHREDKNVQAFEKHKASYLINFLGRVHSPPKETLESCMQKVYSSMEQIKVCYDWTKTYCDAEVAKMMVMDACFILEYIYRISESEATFPGNKLLDTCVFFDLLLLENQIPFFVLDKIFQCTILKFKPNIVSLTELFRPILSDDLLFKTHTDVKTDNNSIRTPHHILSLLHTFYMPPDDVKSVLLSQSLVHSAVGLDRAGVSFKPNPNLKWSMQMEVETCRFPCFFGSWRKSSLKMPVLYVHDASELILRNLIAYEQSFQTITYVTSYAIFMDFLVNTHEDVAKLIASGVLVNNMGSNEETTHIINNICKLIVPTYFYYEEECKILNDHCNSYWPKNISRLRRTYFTSPWSMIALLAGIILFVLTVIQTIFAIKSAGSNTRG